MPQADAIPSAPVAQKRTPQKRGPKNRDRVATGSGVVIGQLRHPKELETRGRGRLRAAFEDIAKRTGSRGPVTDLARIPEGNMRIYLIDVAAGITPAIAASVWFGVNPSTAARWLTEGRAADCPDPIKREFARRTDQAYAAGRADAESRVMLQEPLAALTRGPLGRTTKEIPGWSDERTLKLTDGDGNPPAFTLRLEIGDGYATKPEPRDVTEEPGE